MIKKFKNFNKIDEDIVVGHSTGNFLGNHPKNEELMAHLKKAGDVLCEIAQSGFDSGEIDDTYQAAELVDELSSYLDGRIWGDDNRFNHPPDEFGYSKTPNDPNEIEQK